MIKPRDSVKSEIKNGVLVINVEGSLMGLRVNDPVFEMVKNALESGTKKVLFCMAGLRMIDSTGLGMLLTCLSKTRSAGGELALCGIPGQMKDLLMITKLGSVFNQLPDELSALGFLVRK